MTPFEQRCAREDEEDRLARLAPFIDSRRFALTADDVRHDYRTGRDRYVYRPHGRETLYGTAQYADPFTIDNASNGARR